jgi:hypothetical protein
VEYAARLNRSGLPLEHHVLILNPFGGRLSGVYKRGGLSLSYHAHHLWDYPAEKLLSHPTFYPLAVLGSATSQQHRAEILESAIDTAQQISGTAEARSRTINFATTLAAPFPRYFGVGERAFGKTQGTSVKSRSPTG